MPNARPILVVEDVEEILRMDQMLNQRGHRVVHATNAADAIQIAEQDCPLMILTDLELPTFDALIDRLRKHDGLRNMVVAIIDANDPKIPYESVMILSDFAALDSLLASLPSQV